MFKGSCIGIPSNSDFFSDNHIVTVNGGSPGTYCSAYETTSDGVGGTSWTQDDIDNIRIKRTKIIVCIMKFGKAIVK